MMKDYYKILEISDTASEEVVHMAYKALVKKYHPDSKGQNSDEKADEKIKEINEAYSVLSDKDKRKKYDEQYYFKGKVEGTESRKSEKTEAAPVEPEIKSTEEKGYKKKWYYSYPVLFFTSCFYPVSLILTILRLKDIKKQPRGYRLRTKIAACIHVGMIFIFLCGTWLEYQNSKWVKQYEQYVAEANYSSAKELLDKKSESGMYSSLVNRYMDLYEQYKVKVDFDKVVREYYDGLNDKTMFDTELRDRILKLIPELSKEQQESLNEIIKIVEEEQNKKELKEIETAKETEMTKIKESEEIVVKTEAVPEQDKKVKEESAMETDTIKKEEIFGNKGELRSNVRKTEFVETTESEKNVLETRGLSNEIKEKYYYVQIVLDYENGKKSNSDGTDIEVYVDDKSLGNMKRGEQNAYALALKLGKHKLKIVRNFLDQDKLEFEVTEQNNMHLLPGYYIRFNYQYSWLTNSGKLENVEYTKDINCKEVSLIESKQKDSVIHNPEGYNIDLTELIDSGDSAYLAFIYLAACNVYGKDVADKDYYLSEDTGLAVVYEGRVNPYYIIMNNRYLVYGVQCGMEYTSAKKLLQEQSIEKIDVSNIKEIEFYDCYNINGSWIAIADQNKNGSVSQIFAFVKDADKMKGRISSGLNDVETFFLQEIETNGSIKESGETKIEELESEQEWIFYDSNARFLREEEISDIDQLTLRLAINEIYARHGRIFKNPELNEYFSSKTWYVPLYTSDQFNEDWLNEYEKVNLQLLSSYRGE